MLKVAALINGKARVSRHRAFLRELAPFLHSLGLDLVYTHTLEDSLSYEDQATDFVRQSTERYGLNALIGIGGDGTVNLLAQAIADHGAEETRLGAIGTGSSNDFHKPFNRRYRSIPYRLHFDSATATDLVRVETDERAYAFINSFGMGFVADANWRFNHPSVVLRALKRLHVSTAIGYTALAQLSRFGARELSVAVDDGPVRRIAFSNLHLVKNPFVSGSFHYERTVSESDGKLGFHWIKACSHLTFLSLMGGLLKGRFTGCQGTTSQVVRKVEFRDRESFCFEVDGEVYETRYAAISVSPRKLLIANSR